MLELFQSIFGSRPAAGGKYPASLVDAAIDRAIAATDPRVRALSGHRRRLEPAILKAADHVFTLVDSLLPPVEASRRTYAEDNRLAAFFASVERMEEVFSANRVLIEFLRSPAGAGIEPVLALLVVERTEKKVLGMALQGDSVQREVAQTQVSFDKHRLLDPSVTLEDLRRMLARRAFDQILTLALGRMAVAGGERDAMAAEQSVLRAKLRALQSANWSFAPEDGDGPKDAATIEAQLAEVEKKLASAGAGAATLPLHLDILVDTLAKSAEQLRVERVRVLMDRLGIKQDKPGDTCVELDLHELRNSVGQAFVVLPVAIPREEIRTRDLLAEARLTLL